MVIQNKKSLKNLTLPEGSKKEMKSNQKKEWPRTKTGLTEKVVKSNGQPMPSSFDRFETFDRD